MSEQTVRVLLVDDDRTMLTSLSEMVRECGYEPYAASTWSEALQLFRELDPHIALLDVMMPTIDGFKLTGMLKAATDRFVPIILITGLDDIGSKRRAMAAGADDFLTKPVKPLELEIRLNSMLRIKQLTDEIHEVNTKLAQIAVTDPLTQLFNRRAVYEHLEREFARSQRYGNPFCVYLMDIDHFKNVNDTYGHSVGDQVLVMVSDALRQTVRRTDVVGRYGGEEFIVLAPETDMVNAQILGERLREVVAERTKQADDLPDVTISIGVAQAESGTMTHFEELVHLADSALYEAKRTGRNRCVYVTAESDEAKALVAQLGGDA